jgi:hypothetical protein
VKKLVLFLTALAVIIPAIAIAGSRDQRDRRERRPPPSVQRGERFVQRSIPEVVRVAPPRLNRAAPPAPQYNNCRPSVRVEHARPSRRRVHGRDRLVVDIGFVRMIAPMASPLATYDLYGDGEPQYWYGYGRDRNRVDMIVDPNEVMYVDNVGKLSIFVAPSHWRAVAYVEAWCGTGFDRATNREFRVGPRSKRRGVNLGVPLHGEVMSITTVYADGTPVTHSFRLVRTPPPYLNIVR